VAAQAQTLLLGTKVKQVKLAHQAAADLEIIMGHTAVVQA
jgi:hypothetical protein